MLPCAGSIPGQSPPRLRAARQIARPARNMGPNAGFGARLTGSGERTNLTGEGGLARINEYSDAALEMAMRKLVLESTSPFQGLPELVAFNEGLFEKEGLQIEWADRDEAGIKTVAKDESNPLGVNPFGSHGKLLEQGKADMYNACEWGNYCRVEDTGVGSRQVGRRAVVPYAAILVRPDSPVYTAQQLANRTVGVPFYAGTHYLALHLLSGFLRRD